MTTKRVKKMGKEEMKEMFDLVIYAFNQEPTLNAKNVLKNCCHIRKAMAS